MEDEKFTSLSELLNMRTKTIKNLERELESWEARVTEMQRTHSRYVSYKLIFSDREMVV